MDPWKTNDDRVESHEYGWSRVILTFGPLTGINLGSFEPSVWLTEPLKEREKERREKERTCGGKRKPEIHFSSSFLFYFIFLSKIKGWSTGGGKSRQRWVVDVERVRRKTRRIRRWSYQTRPKSWRKVYSNIWLQGTSGDGEVRSKPIAGSSKQGEKSEAWHHYFKQVF